LGRNNINKGKIKMTKRITKVIAALGVVAGLGVAALPLGSYAAQDQLVSVIVSASGAGTPDCTGNECDIPGTNNATGQTVTIADKDGVRFSLCLTSATGMGTGADETCSDDQGTSATTGTNVTPYHLTRHRRR